MTSISRGQFLLSGDDLDGVMLECLAKGCAWPHMEWRLLDIKDGYDLAVVIELAEAHMRDDHAVVIDGECEST